MFFVQLAKTEYDVMLKSSIITNPIMDYANFYLMD